MALYPVLLDSPLAAPLSGAGVTLLRLPLGTATLLEQLVPRFSFTGQAPQLICAAGQPAPRDIAAWAAPQWAEMLDGHEPGDLFLFVDPRCYPIGPVDFSEYVRVARRNRYATHLTPLHGTTTGLRECVQVAARGGVQRIQRYYDGVTHQTLAGVACSVVSAAVLRSLSTEPIASLSQLRRRLTDAGIPGQDVAHHGPALDLTEEADLLALHERKLLAAVAGAAPAGYRMLAPQQLVATSAQIESGARLVGPVVIHPGATIEAGALVVGPAVIGAASRVRSGAVVAQALLLAGAVIERGVVVRQHICGSLDHTPTTREAGVLRPTEANRASWRRDADLDGESPVRGGVYPGVKRAVDLVVSLAALLVLSPLLGLVALLIKLTSRGPVFYLDEREGRGGRPFHCIKFRTMQRDAHARQRALYRANEVDGPQFKMKSDPRITPLGYYLRALNIDELPQLINVLVGDMSLIGPRPSPFRENQICVPWRNARLSVRPGITGLWQICRQRRSLSDFHQWIHYDTLYVRRLSAMLDLRILVATLLTLGGRWCVPLHLLVPQETEHDGALTVPLADTAFQDG